MAAKTKPKDERETLLAALGDTEDPEPAVEEKEELEPTAPVEKETEDPGGSSKKKASKIPAAKSRAAKKSANGEGGGPAKPVSGKGEAEKPQPKSKKRLMIVIIAGLVVVAGVATAGYVLMKPDDAMETLLTDSTDGQAAETRVARRIDGVLDEPEDQNGFPLTMMVENEVSSRPQAGLDRAHVIFEALAEGGITRFLGVYTLTETFQEIGPIRSARPYFVDWARGYDGLYIHIGGSPRALERIASTNVRDFNQFFNSQYFYRDRSRPVASEHTLFTSKKLMTLASIDKQLPATGSYTGWKFKADAPSTERPASQHLTVDFSTFNYKVDYEYDPAANSYARLQADQPHLMRDGTQVKPKNVVVMTVQRSLEQPSTDNKGRLAMETIGSGQARFFLDGKEAVGTWKKDSSQDPLLFYLADGRELELNAGQTLIEVVPPDRPVTVR